MSELIMPFGAHKGKPMDEVPASYLLWAYENDVARGAVLAYIEAHMPAIRKQIEDGLGDQ